MKIKEFAHGHINSLACPGIAEQTLESFEILEEI